MARRVEWKELSRMLQMNGVRKLYHYTDRDNLASIEEEGGLYAWALLDQRGIKVQCPGGDSLSHRTDARNGVDGFVHLGFSRFSLSLEAALKSGRIKHPVILEISPDLIFDDSTSFCIGSSQTEGATVLSSSGLLEQMDYGILTRDGVEGLSSQDLSMSLSEVLVEGFISIASISNFYEEKEKAEQESRQIVNPRAVVFLVEQTITMSGSTFMGDVKYPRSCLAVAETINRQILQSLRIWDSKGRQASFDIAAVGYGDDCHTAWGRSFRKEGLTFISSDRILASLEENGLTLGSPEEDIIAFAMKNWVTPDDSGFSEQANDSFRILIEMIGGWLDSHERTCQPPLVLHYTTGHEFNNQYDAPTRELIQLEEKLISMSTTVGPTMLAQVQIAQTKRANVILPNLMDSRTMENDSDFLYGLSGRVPSAYRENLEQKMGLNMELARKLMTINAPMEVLVSLIDALLG